jgi:hypothetical protein
MGGTVPAGFDKLRTYIDYVMPHHPIVETTCYHPGIKDFWGTVDCRIAKGSLLHIVDLKWGKWDVPAKDNKQLMSYITLARFLHPECNTFMGSIVQPNVAKPIKVAFFTQQELDDFNGQVIQASARYDRVPGNNQCRFCTLKPQCNEYKDARNRGKVQV